MLGINKEKNVSILWQSRLTPTSIINALHFHKLIDNIRAC